MYNQFLLVSENQKSSQFNDGYRLPPCFIAWVMSSFSCRSFNCSSSVISLLCSSVRIKSATKQMHALFFFSVAQGALTSNSNETPPTVDCL